MKQAASDTWVMACCAVGHFRQLVELSNTDPRFNDKLKQYLIPNKAREHVALAVENDKRLRMWFPEPNTEGGLMYRSVRARVDLDHPDSKFGIVYLVLLVLWVGLFWQFVCWVSVLHRSLCRYMSEDVREVFNVLFCLLVLGVQHCV